MTAPSPMADRLSAAHSASLTLPALPVNLTVVRQVVTGAALVAGLTDADIEDIKVAVTEACTNVIVHAYPTGQTGSMHVGVWTMPSQVVVSVIDTGRGLTSDANGERDGLGLGLGLISALARSVDVASTPGEGTCVWMAFGHDADGDVRGPEPSPSAA
jgi:serine/threonine-protein kinase RsbW